MKLHLPLAGSLSGIAAGIIVASLTLTTPAFAAMQGPAGYLTFWDGCGSAGIGYCGATWALNTGGGIGVCHALPTGANDKPSAFSNNTSHNFRVWTAAGCTGSSAILYGGTETGQLGSGFNNTITAQERIS